MKTKAPCLFQPVLYIFQFIYIQTSLRTETTNPTGLINGSMDGLLLSIILSIYCETSFLATFNLSGQKVKTSAEKFKHL